METVLHLISQYGLIAVFCLLVLGIVGLPVPDETLLTFSGYLIYKGQLHFLPTILTAYAGSICGITMSYIIGRTGGLFLIHKYGPYVHFTPERLDRVHAWFERMGRWALFFGYFMPGIRHFTAIVAGSSELEPHIFAMFAYSGGFLWVLTFVSLGYFLGDQWSRMDQEIHGVLLWLTIAGAVAGLVYWWLRRRKKNRSRSV
jgi:membrane protein DedA with SNARE-associated domain